MEPFNRHTGIVAVLNRGNIDTDQIISKEFLKSISRIGYGEHLFEHWRYNQDGSINKDFELNKPEYAGASILITGNNFGCGSSREHAVWAVAQYGFRVLIAPEVISNGQTINGFADIFKNNSFKNGLLLIEFPEKQVNEMITLVNKEKGLNAMVDLPNQKITFFAPEGDHSFDFKIDSSLKEKLVEGLDEIGMIVKLDSKISAFEATHNAQKYFA